VFPVLGNRVFRTGPVLENYTYLTSGFTLQEPNVYADSNEQIVKGFSNMLWYVLIVIETLLFSGRVSDALFKKPVSFGFCKSLITRADLGRKHSSTST